MKMLLATCLAGVTLFSLGAQPAEASVSGKRYLIEGTCFIPPGFIDGVGGLIDGNVDVTMNANGTFRAVVTSPGIPTQTITGTWTEQDLGGAALVDVQFEVLGIDVGGSGIQFSNQVYGWGGTSGVFCWGSGTEAPANVPKNKNKKKKK